MSATVHWTSTKGGAPRAVQAGAYPARFLRLFLPLLLLFLCFLAFFFCHFNLIQCWNVRITIFVKLQAYTQFVKALPARWDLASHRAI